MAITVNSDQSDIAEALGLLILSERNRNHLQELLDLEADQELPPRLDALIELLAQVEQDHRKRATPEGLPIGSLWGQTH